MLNIIISDLFTSLKVSISKFGDEGVGIKPILIDYPLEPGSMKLGEDVQVVSRLRPAESLDRISGIVEGVNSSFRNQVTKFRVFVHPRIFPDKLDRSKCEEIVKETITEYLKNI